MNAHAKRWVTALTVGPLVIVLVLFGSEFYFAIFMALLIVGAMIEYALMSFGQSARFELGAGIITGLLVIVPAVAGANLYFAAAISRSFHPVIPLFFVPSPKWRRGHCLSGQSGPWLYWNSGLAVSFDHD